MGKKVYAIKEGFDFQNSKRIENKIVTSWNECLKYVKGVKGAKYKSFENLEEASSYLKEGEKLLKKSDDNYPKDCLHIYVDGSYNSELEIYSYGLAAVRNNVVEYIESAAKESSFEKNIRQVAGELEAAVKAVKYAYANGERKVVIFHDYEGISQHAMGLWERREESSIKYYNSMRELMEQGIDVIFVKVDSHTGDFFNELVDEKCKEKVKIKSDKVVQNWLLNNSIEVANEKVKKEILKIAPNAEKNIKVLNIFKEEKASDKFDEIVYKYKNDKLLGKRAIEELNSDEKTEFIVYLLNK